MTKKDQIELLKSSVGSWNQYRKENRDFIPNLSNADLRGADLSGANLRGADLSGADPMQKSKKEKIEAYLEKIESLLGEATGYGELPDYVDCFIVPEMGEALKAIRDILNKPNQ